MPTGNPLNHVVTSAEIEQKYKLSAGTVRQYLKRHAKSLQDRGVLRKADGRTWLWLSAVAEDIWGKPNE
jgi:hypothetical protein